MTEDFDVGSGWHVADPYPFLRRLRAERPVFHSPHLGAYVLTRYADVRAAYGDPRRFSSRGSLTISRSLTAETRAKLGEHGSFLSSFVANVDPPDHTRLRRSVSRAVTPRAVAALRETFQRLNEDLLDRLAPRGTADFVAEIVVPSLKAYERLLTESLLALPMIGDIRSNFALSRLKSDAALPLTHLQRGPAPHGPDCV